MANPTLSQFATSGDGYVRSHGNHTWASIRDGSAGTKTADSTSAVINFVYNDGTTADKYIDRGFFAFDLSSIPAGAEVLSAVLKLYVDGKYTGAGGSVALVAGSQASTTTLATSDFGNVGSTEYMTRINFSSFTTAAYNDLTLNATGIAAATAAVGGTLKLALRGSFDLDNSAPGAAVYSGVYGKATEETGTAKDPYLLVTYTTARSTSDTWLWSDTPDMAGSGGTQLAQSRTSSDTWAWSDAAYKYARSATPVLVRSEGANTTLTGATSSTASTLTVASTAAFPAAGSFGMVDQFNDGVYPERIFTYTSKDSTHFFGVTCSGSAYTFPDGSGIGAFDAENNFPRIVKLDDSTSPVLFLAYRQLFWDGAVNNAKIMARKSYDGGATWTAESQILTPSQALHGYGLVTFLRCADNSMFAAWGEWVHDYSNPRALSVYTSRCAPNADPTVAANWDTPVAVNSVFSKDDMSVCGGVLEYGGEIYLAVYGLDTGTSWADNPNTQYSKLIKTTDKGATTGNWSVVGTIATLAQCNGRASAENSLTVLDNGDWISHMRVEIKLPTYSTLDHYQARSTDHGVTWSGHANVLPQVGNMGVSHQMPEGHVVSQGQDLAHSGQTITYFSTDGAVTWPSTYYRQEATDATYSIGKGSDFKTILRAPDQPSTVRQVVNVFSQEKASQTGSQVKFQWYAVPNFPLAVDTWAWSDAATRTFTQSRTVGAYDGSSGYNHESWLWSDVAVQTSLRTVTDAWAWSDTAAGVRVPTERTTADAWAWSEAAANLEGAGRTTADTWTWSDAVVGSLVGVGGPDRYATDSWDWADTATRAFVAYAPNPGLWHLFKEGELLDAGSVFPSLWSGPYHTFGDPDLRKRVRRIHADGRGEVDVYVATEYDSADGTIDSTVDFSEGEGVFGGGDTFGGGGVFAGGIVIGEDFINSPAPGVARAWSITFASRVGQYWELDAYTIRTLTRKD